MSDDLRERVARAMFPDAWKYARVGPIVIMREQALQHADAAIAECFPEPTPPVDITTLSLPEFLRYEANDWEVDDEILAEGLCSPTSARLREAADAHDALVEALEWALDRQDFTDKYILDKIGVASSIPADIAAKLNARALLASLKTETPETEGAE